MLDDLSPDLEAKLQAYHKAFEEEFQTINASDASEEDKIKARAEQARKSLSESAPLAVSTLLNLASAAASESVKLKAAMYILDRVFGKDMALDAIDPTKELIKELQKSRVQNAD